MAATDVHCHTLVGCVVDVCVRVAPLHPHTALHTTAEAKERPSQQDQNVALLLLVVCIEKKLYFSHLDRIASFINTILDLIDFSNLHCMAFWYPCPELGKIL